MFSHLISQRSSKRLLKVLVKRVWHKLKMVKGLFRTTAKHKGSQDRTDFKPQVNSYSWKFRTNEQGVGHKLELTKRGHCGMKSPDKLS